MLLTQLSDTYLDMTIHSDVIIVSPDKVPIWMLYLIYLMSVAIQNRLTTVSTGKFSYYLKRDVSPVSQQIFKKSFRNTKYTSCNYKVL